MLLNGYTDLKTHVLRAQTL